MRSGFSGMDVVFEPIERWPGEATPYYRQKPSPFDAPWAATIDLLDRELSMIGAKRIVIQAFVKPGQLRLDGGLRSGVNPSQPGVILSFESRKGPLSFPCDTFNKWQANLRAIALALEALRKVDRYGVTRRAEQYTGFKALPKPQSIESEIPTPIAAAKWLIEFLGSHEPAAFAIHDSGVAASLIRRAQFKAHPDRGGNAEDFKRVMRCEQLLKGGAA